MIGAFRCRRCPGNGHASVNALHEMLVEADIESLEYIPSRLNPADGTTKPDPNLSVPVLRLMSGKDVLWRDDPLESTRYAACVHQYSLQGEWYLRNLFHLERQC